MWKKAFSRHFPRTLSLEVHDTSDGADPGAHASPVAVSPVLARPQVVVLSPVVGLLVHEPVAVHHVAGLDVGHAVAIHDVGAVVVQLCHLAAHVVAVIDPHSVGAAVLQGMMGEETGLC